MKIFRKDYKINFVDDQNVLLGFDFEESCCENFGYILSREIPTDENSDSDVDESSLDGFNFDCNFFQAKSNAREWDEGGMAIFRLTKDDEEIFLTLYNFHNGYYSHGFNMEVNGTKLRDGSL